MRKEALEFATKAHVGQKRKDGKDYISHPIAVAEIAKRIAKERFGINFEPSLDIIYVTALLHDVAEDTAYTLEDIEEEFGSDIARYVSLVTKTEGQTYYDFILKLMEGNDGMVTFPIIVKLADLEHNMSDLNEGSLKDKYRFAHALLSTSR